MRAAELLLVSLLSGCMPVEPTALRLHCSWTGITVDQIRFELWRGFMPVAPPDTTPKTPGAPLASGAELLVLVDDALAGTTVHVVATSRRSGQDVDSNSADVTPALHLERTVELSFVVRMMMPQLVGVDCAPGDADVKPNESQQLQLNGHYQDGSTENVTSMAMFTSSDPMIATVSPMGLVFGHKKGDAEVSGAVSGFVGMCNIHVN